MKRLVVTVLLLLLLAVSAGTALTASLDTYNITQEKPLLRREAVIKEQETMMLEPESGREERIDALKKRLEEMKTRWERQKAFRLEAEPLWDRLHELRKEAADLQEELVGERIRIMEILIVALETNDEETLEMLRAHKKAGDSLIRDIRNLKRAKERAWDKFKASRDLDALREVVNLRGQINEKQDELIEHLQEI